MYDIYPHTDPKAVPESPLELMLRGLSGLNKILTLPFSYPGFRKYYNE